MNGHGHVSYASSSVSSAPAGVPPRPGSASNGAAVVMQEYLKGMEAFLETEAQVMGAFLNRDRRRGVPDVAPGSGGQKYPLLGSIVSHVPGEQLVTIRQFSREEDIFLRDHALGSEVSVTDPSLLPMTVVPLTMGMEMLAEAGAFLKPGKVLIGMHDVFAHRWIRVDDVPVSFEISARTRPESPDEVAVQVRELSMAKGQSGSSTVLEAVVLFGNNYPAAAAVFQYPPPLGAALATCFNGSV